MDANDEVREAMLRRAQDLELEANGLRELVEMTKDTNFPLDALAVKWGLIEPPTPFTGC